MKAIIFTGEKGRCAIYGTIDDDELPLPGESVRINNARMIIRVAKVGFVGLASIGPQDGTDSRISAPVPQTTCICRQAEQCTDEAAMAIEAWPIWK